MDNCCSVICTVQRIQHIKEHSSQHFIFDELSQEGRAMHPSGLQGQHEAAHNKVPKVQAVHYKVPFNTFEELRVVTIGSWQFTILKRQT